MKASTKAKNKIKDWFIITRIRLLNFIKEHKYVSAVLGVFLMSAVIALIVRAATDVTVDDALVSVTGGNRGITVTTESDAKDTKIAPNFSKVTYNLHYYLGAGDSRCESGDENVYKADEVEIIATLDDVTNVKWIGGDETTISNISPDGKTLSLKIPQVNMCSEQAQVFTLTVLNAEKDTKVQPKITIKGGTKAVVVNIEQIPTVTTTYDEDKEYSLTPLVKPGIAKKANGNRDVKFGIMLGFNANNGNADSVSLKGAHLSTSADITLIAEQGSKPDYLDLYTKNTNEFDNNPNDGNYYGVNNNSRYFFSPDVLPDLTSTSGKISGLKKLSASEATVGVDSTKTTAPVVTLTGNQNVKIEKFPDNINMTYREANLDDVRISSGIYTEEVYKDGKYVGAEISLNEIGDYELHYKVTDANGASTSVIKKVSIVEPQSENYSLFGLKTIYIEPGETFEEDYLALFNTNAGIPAGQDEYSMRFLKGEEEITLEDLINNPGDYTVEYTILETEEILTRKIKVLEELPSITSEEISIETGNIYDGEDFNNHKIFISSNETVCNKENNCSFKAGESTNSFIYVIDNKKDGYITEIKKNINIVPTQYKLSISDIFPSSTANKVSDNFYAVGAYYVTVKSPRQSDNTEKIDVKLKAILDGKESEAIAENKEYANGYETTSLTNTMYVNESSKLVPVTSDNKNGLYGDYFTASMGEEVKMMSKFIYGADADEDIKKLNIAIPVSGNLIPISYSSESGDSYFYFKATYNGKIEEILPTMDIKYCTGDNICFTPEEFDEQTQVVNRIEITIEPKDTDNFKIKPGMTIEIGTKFKVRTFAGTSEVSNNLNDLKFNGNITFAWNSNGQDLNKSADTPNVYITPYKIRSTISVGNKDNYNVADTVVLSASKNNNYTMFTTLDVTSPAMNINSNIFGYNKINSIPVVFELPSGISYVYNKDYTLVPDIFYVGDKTYLIYEYTAVEPNAWIEPIYFDFNVDVAAITGDFTISAAIGNTTSNDFTIKNDMSSIDKHKIKEKNIRIENVENVSYGQYIYSDGKYVSNIDKEGSFEFSTKLNNNGRNVSDVSVYTVLPYVDTEKESTFSGTFELENLPAGAMCTSDDASKVTKSELVDTINWQPCDDFKVSNNRYTGFSAYKVTYDTLLAGNSVSTTVTMNTIDNNPDDRYTFKSYLQYTNSNGVKSGYIDFTDINLDVISKKITGVVWEDFNVDGIMDDSERKIENVTLKLYNDSDELVQTTTPNKDGKYTFSAVEEGNYYIVADFNAEKYGVTGRPSEDFYDESRLSAFKEVAISKEESDIYEEDIYDEYDDEYEEDDDFIDDSEEDEDIFDDTETDEDEVPEMSIVKTDIISIGSETRIVRNINLGLSLRKVFKLQINKYITRAEVTNALGIVTTRDYGNTKLAKLDVKDINNLKIKVVYTLEIENVKYYPGYATLITEQIPDGMSFNPDYAENKGWVLSEDGMLSNTTLADVLINENEKKYLTVAFDITRKEAGSFINFASVDELQILGGIGNE